MIYELDHVDRNRCCIKAIGLQYIIYSYAMLGLTHFTVIGKLELETANKQWQPNI